MTFCAKLFWSLSWFHSVSIVTSQSHFEIIDEVIFDNRASVFLYVQLIFCVSVEYIVYPFMFLRWFLIFYIFFCSSFLLSSANNVRITIMSTILIGRQFNFCYFQKVVLFPKDYSIFIYWRNDLYSTLSCHPFYSYLIIYFLKMAKF